MDAMFYIQASTKQQASYIFSTDESPNDFGKNH